MPRTAPKRALFLTLAITICGIDVCAGQLAAEETLVRDNCAFAIDLYRTLSASEGNILFSPFSISSAMAMTWAGARGNTATEMASVLKFSLGQELLHPAFAELNSDLERAADSGAVALAIANSLWLQQGYNLLDSYLDLTRRFYGTSVTPVDYVSRADAARSSINEWTASRTNNCIRDIIQPGMLDDQTRLVLVNAIYFKGSWDSLFRPNATRDGPFFVSSDRSISTPMMTKTDKYQYGENDCLQILALPYKSGMLSLLVLLPKATDGLDEIERQLSPELLGDWKRCLREREVTVYLPKFRITYFLDLRQSLTSMGMFDAFDSRADFSGMSDGALFISNVLHEAFIDVSEEGTEAAAATAVVTSWGGGRSIYGGTEFHADHPFLFLIQENWTKSILFMGRVLDPSQ